jgi:hypothetical protein
MKPSNRSLTDLANDYANSRKINIDFQSPLGEGTDGTVWATSRGSAVKVLYRQKNYNNERDSYLRLREAGIDRIGALTVPLLVDFDDRHFAIEMGVVQPPFLLDFGKVYLDIPPPYWSDSQLMANFHAEGQELFGVDWQTVQSVLAFLRGLGIYYVDPKPGNISFEGRD